MWPGGGPGVQGWAGDRANCRGSGGMVYAPTVSEYGEAVCKLRWVGVRGTGEVWWA